MILLIGIILACMFLYVLLDSDLIWLGIIGISIMVFLFILPLLLPFILIGGGIFAFLLLFDDDD